MTNTYTKAQLSNLPENHVYAKKAVDKNWQSQADLVRADYESLAINPGIHVVRACVGIVYLANYYMVINEARKIEARKMETR